MKTIKHILNEGFDKLLETKEVVKESAPDAPLTEKQKKIAIELRRTLEDCLHRKDAPTSLKDIEYALQNVIERYFPDNAWWEVADIDIFSELLSNKDSLSDLLFVPIKIAKSIKPEFLGEEKEYGFDDCDDGDSKCEGFDDSRIISFSCEDDLSKYTDSMLFDSGNRIAYMKCVIGGKEVELSLEIAGDVRVVYKDDVYRYPSDFPKALVDAVKSGEFYGREDIDIGENNWFEYVYTFDGVTDGAVFEDDLSVYTKDMLKDDMFEFCKEVVRAYSDVDECNESADNGLTRSEESRFVSALYSALQKEPYGYSAEEAHEIAVKRAEDLDPSWRVRWNNNLDAQIRQELKYTVTKAEYDAELGEGKCNESVGDRVAEYQKWVDYDMKKYGKISGKTMGILKRDGFTVVKDEYGDLEVIPEEKDHSSIKESKEDEVKGWWDEVEKWNAKNGNKYTIDNDGATPEEMRVAMWDMLMELKGVAPELYKKGKKIYNKYRGITKITEGKRSNKRTFRYDVGDNKYYFYCETEDTRYGFRHLCSMFLRGVEVGDSVKKYYNRTWEMFYYQSAMISAVENSSVSEEDKKSLKAQINEGEGLREGKECVGKQCEDFDDDISDEEYYAELEKHIAEIPSYDDEKLKAEYKEFKDSTHEDDIRVETALKDEMVKRGFIRVFKSAKESVDESEQLNEGTSNFWTMSKLPLLIFDDDETVYDNLYDVARLELGTDASDEEVSDKVEELYDDIDYCTLVDEEIEGLKQDVEDFNRENSDTEIKVEIKPGYYEAYQLYCNDKELSDEEVEKVAKFFDDMKKKYYLTSLKVAYRASNGETGYSIIDD